MLFVRISAFVSRHVCLQVILPAICWVLNYYLILGVVVYGAPSWVTPGFSQGLAIVCVVCGIALSAYVMWICRTFGWMFRELAAGPSE